MNTKGKIEVMQAYLDGKTIQRCSRFITREWADWTYGYEPVWDFNTFHYRVKPNEKVKKTAKYLCYENRDGYLLWVNESSNQEGWGEVYNRIPELDKAREYEVEE